MLRGRRNGAGGDSHSIVGRDTFSAGPLVAGLTVEGGERNSLPRPAGVV